jgi:hypothetical protein
VTTAMTAPRAVKLLRVRHLRTAPGSLTPT